MKIIEPYYKFETAIEGNYGIQMLELIERAARTCYKSECKIEPGSAPGFVRKIAQVKKHRSVIEHCSVSVRFIVDRGVSHELVRHRLCAVSQESTRYCNYSKDQFGREITVIRTPFWQETDSRFASWKIACEEAEKQYFALLNFGATPQEARSVLPNSIKTELVMTANLREWHHVLTLRTSKAAHPQMQQIMRPLLLEFQQHLAPIFDDIVIV